MSRIFLKITSEPQAEEKIFLGTDGFPPLKGSACNGMRNRWYNRGIRLPSFYRMEAFIFWSNGSRARAAFRRPCPVLLDLSSLTYASKPASSASKIPRTLLAEMCKAVFSERIFVQARHWPQVILDVLPRTITKHGRKTARKNRYGFDTRWTKEL